MTARILTILVVVPGLVLATVSPTPSPSPGNSVLGSGEKSRAAQPFSTPIPTPPVINAQAAVLFDAQTGKVLFKHNANEFRQVASTQKLLTALIIAEAGNLDKPVTIERSDTLVSPTKSGMQPGEVHTRQDLLTFLLIRSANDLAIALARDNAGSTEAFAEKMNQRMKELRATSSYFENPNGLPNDAQGSTARDMAILARAVYANPTLRNIVQFRTYTFRFNSGKTVVLRNTNHVLLDYAFCNGMKTGYTEKAGNCLVASGSWNGKDVIAVILGEPDRSRLWKDAKSLLVYGLGMRPEDVAAARLKPPAQQHKHTAVASKSSRKKSGSKKRRS